MEIRVGSILEGQVTGLSKFGAFIKLSNGQTGLVHISEVANTYVKDIKDHLKEHDKVRVKVVEVKDHKIGLSIKQAAPAPPPPVFSQPTATKNESFEEKLGRFLKDSNEKQVTLKKHNDNKRGR